MKIKGGQNTRLQVDTGATCNVIRSKELRGTKYEKAISKTNQVLRMYNSSPLTPTGICHVQRTNATNGQKYNVKFVVVDETDAAINLLRNRTAQQMKLIQVHHQNIQTEIHEVQEMGSQGPSETANDALTPGHQRMGTLTKEDMLRKYPAVFEGLGDLGEPLHLEVDDTVTPVQIPPRRIPEALRQPLKDHLCELEEQGIIQKVREPTEWVSSIVVNKKSNGKIRLCLDPQPLNKALKRCHYPIPTIEEVLPDLHDVKVFSKVDCNNGYWQIKLDQESSLLTTFNTPFGRYKWNRMPFGISPAV